MYKDVIEKMVNLEIDEEFVFYIRDEEDHEIEFPICVKMVEEFQTIMIITGVLGMGGFNMIFPYDDNMVNRDEVVRKIIHEEFAKELEGYELLTM